MVDEQGFSPLAVANALIEIAAPNGGIDHLRLQKQLYIAHGIHLAVTRLPLVRGGFNAWQYGPVSPEIYHAAKHHGSWRIVAALSDARLEQEDSALTPNPAYARKLLAHVWDGYRQFTSFQLVDLTHRHDTPWYAVTNGGTNIWSGHQIPDDLIQKHYEELLQR